jgi:hypothetical protein
MTLDEITSALKLPDTTPLAALRAGVGKTDELAPLVFAMADKLCRGVYLLREENDLLFTVCTFLPPQGIPSFLTVF